MEIGKPLFSNSKAAKKMEVMLQFKRRLVHQVDKNWDLEIS